ncbi:cell division-specific peptidoglycan biosynthesis regulator FtsW [Sinobacterium caligoides]|uniref:Probable peptidoglycan glycosyltransferase FtsW n=1 Tax=Sinobacterium caligoides TaxID=933926 RepID=A0A3N2D531_9GAMM|nr:putative lipid II flippase FtsW [Sinobacterium caligoides]ROR94782.1 cell division-specific peptidoglycan biosynthesis regulator FtsW [Sinobacterium caligoides]
MSIADRQLSFELPSALTDARVDWPLLLAAVLLTCTGLTMMASASIDYADLNYSGPFYHVMRHAIYLLIALCAGFAVYSLPPAKWRNSGALLLLIGFILALLVLVAGREVNGSKRWLALGPITLQVSELIKPIVVVYISGYLVRREFEVRNQFSGFVKPMLVLAMFIILLLLEPDFGAVVVMTMTALGLMFLGGVKLWQFVMTMFICGGAAVLAVVSSEYRLRRVLAYTDPWADQYNSGYQLTQSLIAFGRGEWFGMGLGNSVQKLFYLPEAHTDFVYAILAEELGVVGAIAVILGFVFLISRMLLVGREAEKKEQFFWAYICYGFGIIFSGQVFINIGVNTGLLPTKGLTLPLISYGGSSLIVCVMMVATVLRISHELKTAELKSDRVDFSKQAAGVKKPQKKRVAGNPRARRRRDA